MPAIVKLLSPKGETEYVCYDAPGHTPERAKATRFITDSAAWTAARAVIHGDPNAFWNSERRSAEITRERMKGWTATVEAA